MLRLKTALLCVMMIHIVVQAAIITFDDFSTTENVETISEGYKGFSWENFHVFNRHYLPGTGYDAGTVSGDYTAFNGGGQEALISGSAFDFYGAYFTSAWYNDNNVTVTGYRGEEAVYCTTMILNSTEAQWYTFDFFNIDRLSFSSSNWQFAMDNLTIHQYTVPESGMITMLLFSIFPFIGYREKKHTI